MAVGFRQKYKAPVAVDTLDTGITKSNVALPIVKVRDVCNDGVNHLTYVTVNSLVKNIPADAALAFGQKILTLPRGFTQVTGSWMQLTRSSPTGLSATAGEAALGTTIASGAVAVLSGTAAFQNHVRYGTLGNLVAATPKVEKLQVAGGGTPGTDTPIDGDATANPVYLNLASTWDQTAAENLTFSAIIALAWSHLGTLT